jgi:hypothetical protein
VAIWTGVSSSSVCFAMNLFIYCCSAIAKLMWLFRAFPRVVAAVISRLFGVGLFFIQFLEWWQQSEQRQELQRTNTQRLPMPVAPHGKMVHNMMRMFCVRERLCNLRCH